VRDETCRRPSKRGSLKASGEAHHSVYKQGGAIEAVRTEPVVVEEVVPAVRRPIVVAQRVLVPVGGRLDKNDIREVLAGAGYHTVHDIDWHGRSGVWTANGRDPLAR
jgi:hypothetical protein